MTETNDYNRRLAEAAKRWGLTPLKDLPPFSDAQLAQAMAETRPLDMRDLRTRLEDGRAERAQRKAAGSDHCEMVIDSPPALVYLQPETTFWADYLAHLRNYQPPAERTAGDTSQPL